MGKYIKGNNINYQIWEHNKLIKENIEELEFMENFNDKIRKYQYLFQLNDGEIAKFMNIFE